MTFYGFCYVGPADGFKDPDGARAIFFHVPSAYVCILVLTVGTWHALTFLRKTSTNEPLLASEADRKSFAFMESSMVFGIITLITGMIFSNLQWGAFWSWDPRQTSMLIVCLILAGYLVLRGAVEEPATKARLSAAYALIGYLPAIFMLIVMPRIVMSLHPSTTVVAGQLTGGYRVVMYFMALPAFLALAIWIAQLRVRLARLEAAAA
jgi:heme exporter protein C